MITDDEEVVKNFKAIRSGRKAQNGTIADRCFKLL
jgi:hypothetical protein